jgi:hypothetical protein
MLFYVVLRSNCFSTYLVPFLGIYTCVVVSVAREHHVIIDKHVEAG